MLWCLTGIVHSNTIQSVTTMFDAFEKLSVDIPGDLADLKGKFDAIKKEEKLDPEIGALVKSIWEHASIKVHVACMLRNDARAPRLLATEYIRPARRMQ